MTPFTNQQLHSGIAQLDQAIYNHEQWYKSVLRVLISHVPPDVSDMAHDAHRRCRLGQWYESIPAEFLHDNPTFSSMGLAHESMHKCARTLLQRVSDGLPISPSDLDQFNNTLDRLRLEVHALRHEFAEAAQNRDPLTEARNRATLLSDLREQHSLARREVQVSALAMLDLDHFKQINDNYGHTAGDAVLVATSKTLQATLRPYDRIYRYGGEEFLLCFPDATVEQARTTAERIRKDIADQRIPIDEEDQFVRVTVSIGVADLLPSRSIEASIDCADKAMYEAKAAGRNCVIAERLPAFADT